LLAPTLMTGPRCLDPVGGFIVPPWTPHGASIPLLRIVPGFLTGAWLLLPLPIWLIGRRRSLCALLAGATATLLRLLATKLVGGVGWSLGALLTLAAALLPSILAASIGSTSDTLPALLLSTALLPPILAASFRFSVTGWLVRWLGWTLRVLRGSTAATAIAGPLGLCLLLRRPFRAGTLPLFAILVVVQTENLLAHRPHAATPA